MLPITPSRDIQNGRTRGNRTLIEGLKVLCQTFQLWSQKSGGSAEIRTQNNWVRASYDTLFHHKPIIKIWRSLRDSNSCTRRERAISLPLDEGNKFGAFRETRTPNLLITNQLHYQLCYEGEIVTTAHTPAVIGGFPTSEQMRSKPYPRNNIFKQQEQSRWTLYQPYRTIIAHKVEKHNSKNPNKINRLKDRCFRCGRGNS